MDKKNLLIRLGGLLGFVVFCNIFFFHNEGFVSWALTLIGAFVFLLLIVRGKVEKHLLATIGGLFALVFASALNIIRVGNITIGNLSFLAGLSSILLLLYVLATDLSFARSLFEVIASPFRLFIGYLKGIGGVFSLFMGKEEEKIFGKGVAGNVWPILRSLIVGSIVGIPLVLLLLSMFSHADPIFAYSAKQFFSLELLKQLPQRFFWSILLLFLFAPFMFLRLSDRIRSPFSFLSRFGWVRETTVAMILVALVLGSFLVVQWPYIFASVPAETDLSRFGVPTYSEYVKRGFGELLRIALVLYGLVWAGLLMLRDKERSNRGILPYVQLVVLAELLFFIGSVFRRIWLYQLHHGWTLVRIYGGVFLLWLTGMVIFLAARHMAKKRWVIGEVILTAATVLALGVVNVEHFIATSHPPTVNKRVDYVYLSRMSTDGFVGWQMALDHAQSVLTNPAYKEKKLLDNHDRRDIAYAGYIVLQLSKQYHRFMKWYGLDKEQQEYVQAIVAFQKTLSAENDGAQTDDHIIEWIDKAQRDKRSFFEILSQVQVRSLYYPYAIDFSKMKRENFANAFALVEQPSRDTLDALDRFFVWNWSESRAFARMKEVMHHDRLFMLQRAFRDLGRKITAQPSNEQTYETDISFTAPFLETLP